MGWLRDYLWLNSSQLINGYNPFGMNSLSIWAWMFLFPVLRDELLALVLHFVSVDQGERGLTFL